jgi:hypothetical protein
LKFLDGLLIHKNGAVNSIQLCYEVKESSKCQWHGILVIHRQNVAGCKNHLQKIKLKDHKNIYDTMRSNKAENGRNRPLGL